MKLFRLAGIDVFVHGSWLIIFALLVWSFSFGFFPLMYPGLGLAACLTLGVVTTLLFFGSVLIHELSHSVVALADGMQVRGITLFIFGGVSQITGDCLSPRSEFRIAAAGPFASFVLGILFAGGGFLGGRPATDPWNGMMVHLALMNISLGVFNLLPGFPLDGGRLVRALLWRRNGDRLRATISAARLGRGMSWCLILLGLWLTAGGYFIQGIWIAFIGFYLDRAAASEQRDAILSEKLAALSVETVMTPEAITIPARETAADALMWFRRDGFSGYPVMQDERVVGVISLGQIESCPPPRRGSTPVAELMTPLTPDQMATPDESLLSAVGKMTLHGLSRLPVLGRAGGGLAGLLTRHAVAQRLRLTGLVSGQS